MGLIMRTIVWKDENSVGVKELDQQHKEVINFLNHMFEIFEGQLNPDFLNELLIKLDQYAKNHFATEEGLLEKYKYHDKEAHIREHNIYRNKIITLRQELDSNDKHAIEDTLEFLADWWMGHIQGCDKEYTRYLNNCGVF
jgi:hemerythrin-like metal-binding protein